MRSGRNSIYSMTWMRAEKMKSKTQILNLVILKNWKKKILYHIF